MVSKIDINLHFQNKFNYLHENLFVQPFAIIQFQVYFEFRRIHNLFIGNMNEIQLAITASADWPHVFIHESLYDPFHKERVKKYESEPRAYRLNVVQLN